MKMWPVCESESKPMLNGSQKYLFLPFDENKNTYFTEPGVFSSGLRCIGIRSSNGDKTTEMLKQRRLAM